MTSSSSIARQQEDSIFQHLVSLYYNEQQYIGTLKKLTVSLNKEITEIFNHLVTTHQDLFQILSEQIDFDSRSLIDDLQCFTEISQWAFSNFSIRYLDYCIHYMSLQKEPDNSTQVSLISTLLKLPFIRYKSFMEFFTQVYECSRINTSQVNKVNSKYAKMTKIFNTICKYSNIQWLIMRNYLNNEKLFLDYFQVSYSNLRKLDDLSFLSLLKPPFDINQILKRDHFELSLIHPRKEQFLSTKTIELILVSNHFYLDYEKLHDLNAEESLFHFKKLKAFLMNQRLTNIESLKLDLFQDLRFDIDQLTIEQLADLQSSSIEEIYKGSSDFSFNEISALYIAGIRNGESYEDQIGRELLFGKFSKNDLRISSINKGRKEIHLVLNESISLKLSTQDNSLFYTWLPYFKYLFPYYHHKEIVSDEDSIFSTNALGIDFRASLIAEENAVHNIADDIKPLKLENSTSFKRFCVGKYSNKSTSTISRSASLKSSRLSILSLEIENTDIDTFINILEGGNGCADHETSNSNSSTTFSSFSSSSSSTRRRNNKLSKSSKISNFEAVFYPDDDDDWTTINSSSMYGSSSSSSSDRCSMKSRQQSTASNDGVSLSNSTSFYHNITSIIKEETEEDLHNEQKLEKIPEVHKDEKNIEVSNLLSNASNNASDCTITGNKAIDESLKEKNIQSPCTPKMVKTLEQSSLVSKSIKLQQGFLQFSAFRTPSTYHPESPRVLTSPQCTKIVDSIKQSKANPSLSKFASYSAKSQNTALPPPPSINGSKKSTLINQQAPRSYNASSSEESSSRSSSPITSVFASASSPLKKFFSRKSIKRKQGTKRSSIILNSGLPMNEKHNGSINKRNALNVNGTVLTNYEVSKKKINFNPLTVNGYMTPEMKIVKTGIISDYDDYQLTTLEKSPTYKANKRLSYINGVSTKISKSSAKRNSLIMPDNSLTKPIGNSASSKSLASSPSTNSFNQKRNSNITKNRKSIQKEVLNFKQQQQLIDLLSSTSISENKGISKELIAATQNSPSVMIFRSESPLGSPRFANFSIPNNYSVSSLNNSQVSSPGIMTNVISNNLSEGSGTVSSDDDIPVPKDDVILFPKTQVEKKDIMDVKSLESFGKNHNPNLFSSKKPAKTSSAGNLLRKSSILFMKPEDDVNFEIVTATKRQLTKKQLPHNNDNLTAIANGSAFSVAAALDNYEKAMSGVPGSSMKRKKSIDAMKKFTGPLKEKGKNVKGLKISTMLKNHNDDDSSLTSPKTDCTPAVTNVIDRYIAEKPHPIFKNSHYEVLYWKSNNHWSKLSTNELMVEVSSCAFSEGGYLSLYKEDTYSKPFVVLPIDKNTVITGPSILEENRFFAHLRSFNEVNKKSNLISLQSSDLESLTTLTDSLKSIMEKKDNSLLNSRNQVSNVSSVFDYQRHTSTVQDISRDTSTNSIPSSANELKSPLEYLDSSNKSQLSQPFSPIALTRSFKCLAINDETHLGTRKVRIHKKSSINGKWTPLSICLVDVYQDGKKNTSFRLCVIDNKTRNTLLNITIDGQKCKRIGKTGICIVAPTKDQHNLTRFNYLLESRNIEEAEHFFSILNRTTC